MKFIFGYMAAYAEAKLTKLSSFENMQELPNWASRKRATTVLDSGPVRKVRLFVM